ncbi:isochorismatase family protein [Acinetobacter sp. 3657]|uniref:isochorismatase family protein n=1 Tax=Acinetobacter sp. 3657 TaxID=2817764 RepID=UPI002860BB5D|nr:nicotinamidase-related amidase [Prolinoborus sp. 3657]
MLSPALLTTDTSVVLIIDYQKHVLEGIGSRDHELIELNGKALAKVSKAFGVPTILSTIGVKLRGDEPTLESIRSELPDVPEYDRDTMNTWDDEVVRQAIAATGRRRLIFAGLWTEVCLMYPVIHAQKEGFETYFIEDAVGGSTTIAHETARARMIQAGSQPLTLAALITEWIRDWRTSPHAEQFFQFQSWYQPEIERVRQKLSEKPYTPRAI